MGARGAGLLAAGLGHWATGLTLLGAGPLAGLAAAAAPVLAPTPATADPPDCPKQEAVRPATPPASARVPAGSAADPPAIAATDPSAPGSRSNDYRQAIRFTPWGPALLPHWCVWIEPASSAGPQAWLETRWLSAVEQALASWTALLPITRVDEPERAQLQLLRRRPPRRAEGSGRLRASHGRAELTVLEVERQGSWRLEPSLRVLISPDQRQEAIQATALHELGHGFGLWGHSPDPGDAMAAVPGPRPVLQLSARDRATLDWLRRQPTRFGQWPASPPASGADRRP
ncbi:peptidase [Vulcanococcus limneticus]|uniref:peptidase n=1 Tax=Vulcanococcus limneticus TaxID=2170428 RepID=UPI001E35C219|nr:peptidase [Vulcanococcus limneticus]